MEPGGKSTIATRKQTEVWLIGQIQSSLSHRKLPSKKEVMELFFYYKLNLKQSIRETCISTTDSVMEIWEEARIPTKFKPDVVNKVEKIFREWEKLKKNKENKAKRSEGLKQKEDEWQAGLEDLFDISHANALELIDLQEDRDFLLAQREKGRRGKMGNVDFQLSKKEADLEKKKQQLKRRQERQEEEKRCLSERVVLASSSEDEVEDTASDLEEYTVCTDISVISEDPSTLGCTNPPKRGRKNIIGKELAASLDVAQLSDRKAAAVLIPTIKCLGQEASEFNVNPASIRRQRMKFRQTAAEGLKAAFKASVPLTIHWDGKLMKDIIGKETVDRLPIIISGEGVDQLLGVPKLPSGTGAAIASAVYEAAEEWEICDKVKSMSFDTTSVNTGPRNGACILLEQKLQKDMLWLPCRHHILEIMLEAVIMLSLGPSTGPEILLFKRFQRNWSAIDSSNYQPAVSDTFIRQAVADISDSIIDFSIQQLNNFQPRDDYRELLELTIVFLGGAHMLKGVSFKTPAGMHRARWMVKAIYSLKIWLFREQFKLMKTELAGIQKICLFVVRIYVQFWFQAASATSAPRNDLLLLKALDNYKEHDKAISEVALKKILGHLWYLSEEMVAFSFFDDEVPSETKRKMVCALESSGEEYPQKRITLDPKMIQEKELEDFVTSNTRRFFSILGLTSNFLQKDVNEWQNEEFRAVKASVCSMKVVNDIAERGVALMDEYNKLITNNEEQKQFLLLTVKEYRKKFPNRKKSTLMKA